MRQICRVNRRNLSSNIRSALSFSPSVVVTGTSRTCDLDRPTGKTTAVLNDFAPAAESEGLRVEYFNIGMGLRFSQRQQTFRLLAVNMMEAARLLDKPADIFILNRAFHLFGPPGSSVYMEEMRPHVGGVWEAAGRAADRGSQFVFISSIHPGHRYFMLFEKFPSSALFTRAPILEFKPAGMMRRIISSFTEILP